MSLYPELDDGDAYAPALSSLRHQVQRTNANEFLLPYDDATVTECVQLLLGAREQNLVPPLVVIDEADPVTIDFHWGAHFGTRVLCAVYNGGRMELVRQAAGEEHPSRPVQVDDWYSAVELIAEWLS